MPIWLILRVGCLIYVVGCVKICCFYCWNGLNLVWHAGQLVSSAKLA